MSETPRTIETDKTFVRNYVAKAGENGVSVSTLPASTGAAFRDLVAAGELETFTVVSKAGANVLKVRKV